MTSSTLIGPDVPFADLPSADLVVDAIYGGGNRGNAGDDPLARLLPGIGNQGGFRHCGSPSQGTVTLSVLYTTGDQADWPDQLDTQTGTFTYYGDNRRPGKELHATARGGNVLLRNAFAASHGSADQRAKVPPFLLFERVAGAGRSVRFRGLLAPGGPTLTPDDELAAIWRSTKGQRFQNYRARFTVLDHHTVSRGWIEHLRVGGDPLASGSPPAWTAWVKHRTYTPLLAPATTVIRTKDEQLPDNDHDRAILDAIHTRFSSVPHQFEACAVAIWRLIAPATGRCDTTRPSRDGGRDAIGEYLIGPQSHPITIDFALEAKCYTTSHSVGVHEVARLISRIRHRNFGVLVTTSYFNQQVQEEIRDDAHPIVLISGRDITDALRHHGYTTLKAVHDWLDQSFPAS